VKLVVILVAVAALAASCGKSQGTTLYSAAKTRACLTSDGVPIGGQLDFVATTATGGAFKARLPKNSVTVVFGESVTDADNIDQAYRRFRAKNVGIDDVLRQDRNAVLLWQLHPTDDQAAALGACLK
jgi:hypothetical protein